MTIDMRHSKQSSYPMPDPRDVRIAALEAEVERLKCCGNCGHYSRITMTATYRCNEDRRMPGQPHSMMPWSDCRFIPDKWTMREEATNATARSA